MKLFALIGNPVEHSLSPEMHNAAFQALGLECFYTAFQVDSDRLGEAIEDARAIGIQGLNVTIPHKVSVLQYLDELDDSANQVGAVNTIANRDGRLVGYNTDGLGALRAMEQNNVKPDGRRVMLLGAGGAARAIAFTLAGRVESLSILNRSGNKAKNLAADLQSIFGKHVSWGSLTPTAVAKVIETAEIIINSTPVGMYPQVEETIIDRELLRPNMAVFDIVYNPIKTKLLKDAEATGARTVSGVEMLLHQGAEAFKTWLGIMPPINVMREAAVKRLVEV